ARPEEAEELAVANLEIDVVDREEADVGICAGNVLGGAAPRGVAAKALRERAQPDCDVSHPGGGLLLRSLGLALRSRAAIPTRGGRIGTAARQCQTTDFPDVAVQTAARFA